MSRQRSLEQNRAEAAWKAVQAVKAKKYEKEYGQLARSAAADVQANGLGQTLAFWRAKGYEKGRLKDDKAHGHLLGDVSRWVCQQLRLDPQAGDLLNWITTKAGTDEYRRATAEALAYLNWLKRFAEAELADEQAAGGTP